MGTSTSPPAFAADPDVARTLELDRRGRRMRWVRRAVLLAALVAAIAAIVQVARGAGGRAPTTVLDTRPARRGELVVTVTATGTLEPVTAVDIAPEISGRVKRVLVDYNDKVEKGQVLLELDTDLLAAQAEQAAAQVALAVANTAQARATQVETKKNLERARSLIERGVGAAADLDAASAAAARAVAALAAAAAQERNGRASLRVAETTLAKATLRSPISGVVLSRSVDEGQTVVAALQAPTVFRLAEDLRRMQLVVDVDEADIGHVTAGLAASFTVAAFPERRFTAKVTEVRNAPKERENVVTYGAVLELDNAEGLLRPGMTGTAQIAAETVKDALLVPNAALRWRPAGATDDSTPRVYLDQGGKPVAATVTPGVTDGTSTVVRAGEVATGAAVIVGTREQRP
jgi:HlyD family secretion protein